MFPIFGNAHFHAQSLKNKNKTSFMDVKISVAKREDHLTDLFFLSTCINISSCTRSVVIPGARGNNVLSQSALSGVIPISQSKG